jgi:hypothetical protein
VVFVESASILGNGIKETTKGRFTFSVDRMSMGSSYYIRMDGINLRMNSKGCPIYWILTIDDVTILVN